MIDEIMYQKCGGIWVLTSPHTPPYAHAMPYSPERQVLVVEVKGWIEEARGFRVQRKGEEYIYLNIILKVLRDRMAASYFI